MTYILCGQRGDPSATLGMTYMVNVKTQKKDNPKVAFIYKVWLLSFLVAPLAVGVGAKVGVVEAAFARNLPA